MAHYLTNNEKFHIFSKSPVLSSMAVSQAVNKSGHTVSTNDVWADDVPWFTEVADEAGAITRAADARYNDLILWGSDIYVRKGDKTNGASTGTTFAELWEKHTDLTEARAYALGSVTTQTPTNIVTKTVELKNASDKVVLKYHVGKQIDLLTTANNANVASTWAARMFIDGKVVDQFVSPTDKVFAGNPSTGYTTLVYTATAAGNNYGFVAEGEADEDFVNNAFAGIVQFNQSRNDTHKFAASVFEYVGDKLDSTVAKLSAAVFGSGGDSDQPTDLVTQVNLNTAAITTLNGDVNTNGSIAQKIDTAIDGLGDVAVKSDITITDIKVKQGSGEAESLTITDKSVIIEIPEVPAAVVTEEGAVTTDGFTKTADVTNLANAAIKSALSDTDGVIADAITNAISDATLGEGEKIADTEDTSKLVTVEDVTTYVSENAKVTLTADTADGKTGITIDNNGQAATSFTIGIDQTKIATKQSVDDLSSLVSGLPATIQAAQDTADEAKGIAETAIQTVTVNGTESSGTTVSITALTAVDSDNVGSNGITIGETDKKVTLSVTPATYTKKNGETPGSWGDVKTNFATAQSVIDAIADAVNGVTIPSVTTSTAAQTVGVTASGHEVSVATATYTPASGDTAASWTEKGYLVTGSTVETFVGAETAKALEEAKAYSDSLHTTSLDYVVLGDGESLPTASADTLGKIYLVAKANVPAEDGSALSGDYVEYMTRKVSETEYTWEKIGTTSADLSAYAKKADLNVTETTANGLTYSQTNGVVSASVAKASTSQVGTVQLTDTYTATDDTKAATGKSIAAAIATLDATDIGDDAVKVSQTDGIVSSVSVDTEALVENGSIKASVTDANALVKAADALEAIKLAKPENYVASVTGYTAEGEEVTTSQGAAVKVLDGRGTSVTANDLWGTTATMDESGVITVDHKYLTNPKGELAWLSNVTKVENNKAYNGDSFVANIQTEMFKDGSYMFYFTTSLASFNGDLSSLVNGERMFYKTNLTSFSGDLSSLVNGSSMFSNTPLKSFSGDLSSLVKGYEMFHATSFESFTSDLSNLVTGFSMFSNTPLKSFSGDLSSLVDGRWMFQYDISLVSFNGDLSSLVNGESMFQLTKLDTESVECIADTIRNVTDLSDSTITGSDGKTYNVTKRIDIGIANETPNEAENAAFWTMHNDKGWNVYIKGSLYNPTEPTAIATLDENGEEVSTPIPFWAKPVETDEEHAEYVGEDGKFYNVVGGQFIYVSDPETYGQFTSLADAVANMRLTKIEKKDQIENKA